MIFLICYISTFRWHQFFSKLEEKRIKQDAPGKDIMTTKANQAQLEAAHLAPCTSPSSNGSRQSRESRITNNSQDLQQCYDLWHSTQRSSPPLLFYRKLSSDRGTENIWNEDYDCVDCSSKVLSTSVKLYPEVSTIIDGITNAGSLISSDRTQCQLDTSLEGVDGHRKRTGSTHLCCTTCSLCTSSNKTCCHSPISTPGPCLSPVHSPCLNSSSSWPKQRHIRRSSLPVSMLGFHKVNKEQANSKLFAVSRYNKAVLCHLHPKISVYTLNDNVLRPWSCL